MLLRKLKVHGFRNLENCELEFSRRITTITGRNGQGKTSLLEAIFLLGFHRSFRNAKLINLYPWEKAGDKNNGDKKTGDKSDNFYQASEVQGVFFDEELQTTVELGYHLYPARREIFVNQKKVTSLKSFYGRMKVLEFSPDDLTLIKGSPSERKNFLDHILCQIEPECLETLIRYDKILRSRNKILSEEQVSHQELDTMDELLVPLMREVAIKRRSLIAGIREYLIKPNFALLGQDHLELEILHESTIFDDEGRLKEEKELLGLLQNDRRTKRTSIGPHRDDLKILFGGGFLTNTAREHASQGQTRAMTVALKLACLELIAQKTGIQPILLLDDVDSEFDQGRRRALGELLEALKSQIFITATERSRLDFLPLTETFAVEIEDGKIL